MGIQKFKQNLAQAIVNIDNASIKNTTDIAVRNLLNDTSDGLIACTAGVVLLCSRLWTGNAWVGRVRRYELAIELKSENERVYKNKQLFIDNNQQKKE